MVALCPGGSGDVCAEHSSGREGQPRALAVLGGSGAAWGPPSPPCECGRPFPGTCGGLQWWGRAEPGTPPTGSCALTQPIPQDTDIQKKIDHEIRMREGACKLLAACTQREQALEATKSLLVCNSRILAYMSELQRMKEVQVMQRVARR